MNQGHGSRGFFGAGMVFSLVGAGILGSVLAWSNSTKVSGQASVGDIAFDFGPDNSYLQGRPVYLKAGDTIVVATGKLRNTGSFRIQIDPQSTVEVLDVTNPPEIPADSRPCAPGDFSGSLQAGGQGTPTPLPGEDGAPFYIYLTMAADAPPACTDQDVSYAVRIVARTASGGSYVTGGRLPGGEPPPAPGATSSATAAASASASAAAPSASAAAPSATPPAPSATQAAPAPSQTQAPAPSAAAGGQ